MGASCLGSYQCVLTADQGLKCFNVLDPGTGLIIVSYHPHSAISYQHYVDLCEKNGLFKVHGLKCLKYNGTRFILGILKFPNLSVNNTGKTETHGAYL